MYLLQGLSFGFSASVSPGPFTAYLLSQTARGGWRRSLPITFAPLVSDAPIVTLALLLLTHVPDWFMRAIQIAGGVLLIFLAQGSFSNAWAPVSAAAGPHDSALRKGGFVKGVAMNALSPGPYLFWSTVLGPVALKGWQQSPAFGLGFVGAFYTALIGCTIGIILLFAAARHVAPRLTLALNLFAAATLLVFGLFQLWQGFGGM
jgi:threonine/homoserine/homoserine lactone efflux protein